METAPRTVVRVETRTHTGPDAQVDDGYASQLARVISEVTGAKVTYRDLSAGEYAAALQQSGLDGSTARFVAALDASIARGDLETSSQELAHLLGRPATPLAEVVRAGYNLLKVRKG